MKSTRRGFIKAACAGAGLYVLAPGLSYAAEEKTFGPDEVGMLYDSTLCVGCKACVYSCKAANFDSDDSSKLSKEDSEDTRWFNVYDLDYKTKNIIKLYEEKNANGEVVDFAFIKRQCMHCKSAGCVSACPVSAMIKNPETGVVEYYKNRCIGCRYCQMACPFNVPKFEWHRAIPKITKCELCRENENTNGTPACCTVCPTKAVIYGKRASLLSTAKKRISAEPGKYINKIYGEYDYGGTNVLYLSKVDFEKLGMPNLPDYSFATKSETVQHTIYKGFIAPVALYAVLAVFALKHKSKRDKEGGDK